MMETNSMIVFVVDAAVALLVVYAAYYAQQQRKKRAETAKATAPVAEAPKPEPVKPVEEPKPTAPVEAPKAEATPPPPVPAPQSTPVEAMKAKPAPPAPEPQPAKVEAPKAKPNNKKGAAEKKERGFPVIDIEGIGKTYAGKLHALNIYHTSELLAAGATPHGRRELAEKTGISHELLLEWVNLADLFRIKGIGEEYSDLLEEAGVDTVVELSHRNAEHLHAKMLEVNEAKKLVRRPPTLASVEAWIKEAKSLPRVIEY